ncbi:MAG: PP2C family protein-serine/threonine phosphatase [Planctomycetes bacterium]|nr:PP2C family protein-serine/threonine phosphatase [Planctomycetota bacterium]MCB9884928.1 PP2C family protein-serine/threonine phosphatase [Planctomycetota bacterium]
MEAAATHAWSGAAALAGLHACRSIGELDARLVEHLGVTLGGPAFALLLADGDELGWRVVACGGEGCPLQGRERAGREEWQVPAAQRLPVSYGHHRLGELLVGEPLAEETAGAVQATLAHYATALVNHTLNAEARQATEHYCASLQALEEGIVLFQEEDADAVMARLLSLAMAMVEATAGVLYVLREVGDADSGLRADQVLGLPETLLDSLVAADSRAWPECLMEQGPQWFERAADGSLGGIAAGSLPPVVGNMVALPLRYHGVDAGVCVLFNAAIEAGTARDYLGRVQSLGHLGAALLHRLKLEAMTARNRSIARELEIAGAIQKRLLPAAAPATDDFDFSWRSIAAQNIGGDYLDLLMSDLGDVYAVVADASGHGINSAMLMTSFRSTYRADAPWQEPEDLLAALNREVVHEVGATGMFITAATLRIERGSNLMTLSSAGHNPIFLYRARTGEVESIASHGPPLGFLGGATYASYQTVLQTGDILLLYTDGITEALGADQEMFGEERLAALLRRHAADAAEVMLGAMQKALCEFAGRTNHEDDVSMTVIKVN